MGGDPKNFQEANWEVRQRKEETPVWGLLTCIIKHVTTLGNWGSLLLENSDDADCRFTTWLNIAIT